jgi:asparagine synthase (glutamine-hydrolysing)
MTRSEPHCDLVETTKRMSAAMIYDSSYSQVLFSWPSLGACVGWVGITDCSRSPWAGPQTDGFVVAVTTAGIDSRPCRKMGDATFSRSAQQVVGAYESGGDASVTDLAGIIAGFVVDDARRRCLLFNDRYGRERVFVHTSGTRILFSSEAKAILAVASATREFDPAGLAEWLSCGCTLGARSLFRDVEVLPGGTILTFENGAVQRRRYFDLTQLEALPTAPAAEFLEGFSQSLATAVNQSLRGSAKVGISLTGGLDSRMIMASLDSASGEVPCYTFGSMYRTTRDVSVARQVAAACGQPHHVIEVGKEFLENTGEHLEKAVYASDGYLGLSGAAELYCNRLARTIAPCRMTGNWGGELMRGVRAFKYALPKGGFINLDLADHVRASAETFSPPSSNSLSAALFQQVPHQGYGRYAIERSQVRLESPFLDTQVIRWLYRAPAAIRESSATAAAVISRRPGLLGIPTDAGLLGIKPSPWRREWRRAAAKAEYLTSHGAPDWLAKLSSTIPARMLETRFLGLDKFHHFRFWIRHDLAGLVRDTLFGRDRDELAAWFDMRRVRRMVTEHVEGRANHTDAIDKLLTVALARRKLLGPPTFTDTVPVNHAEFVS